MILGSLVLKECIRLDAIKVFDCLNTQLGVEDLVIGPNSIDVRLHSVMQMDFHGIEVDPYQPLACTGNVRELPNVIEPGECLLGCTEERFEINKYGVQSVIEFFYPSFQSVTFQVVQEYHGRSTVGRIFLASHVTAAFGDVGFNNAWTLELVNHNPKPIVLHKGMRIGQVAFSLVLGASSYSGAYTSQHSGPGLPVLGKDRFDIS